MTIILFKIKKYFNLFYAVLATLLCRPHQTPLLLPLLLAVIALALYIFFFNFYILFCMHHHYIIIIFSFSFLMSIYSSEYMVNQLMCFFFVVAKFASL